MRILFTFFFFLFVAVSFSSVLAQSSATQTQAQQSGLNRFEGYNIFVDAVENPTQALGACATRYVPPSTQITITDLNSATPMKLQSCSGGNFAPVRQLNASTASVNANEVDYKWCFVGEDKMYRISFQGDKYTPKLTYNWIATPNERDLGFYNVRDFGAKGDGRTDDTVAIKSAVAFIASRNGGRLIFPDGDYLVGNPPEYPNFKGITLPSGITIEGTGSNATNTPIGNVVKRNASRITLNGTNRAIFRIGECTERVTVRDIELYANSNENTYAVEGFGAFNPSQEFFFERLSISNFFRGIYIRDLPINQLHWQIDFLKIDNCRFMLNRDAAVWIDAYNSNLAIRKSLFFTPNKAPGTAANGIYLYRYGTLLLEDSFAGTPNGLRGGDFISVIESGNLTIIGSQCERMSRSIVFGEIPGAGNYSYPLTLIGNIFEDPIEIKARRTVVSTGNLYWANTFKLNQDVRIYSTGDRFCYDGNTGCVNDPGPANFQGGQVIFSTGQPADGKTPGRPTVFGHDVQFNAPIQVQNVPFNNLPTRNVGNGSFVYCTNCRRSTAPCQAGGNGAPAMNVGGRWECL